MEWTGHSLAVLNGILALLWGQRLDFSVLEIVGSDEAIVFLFLIIRKIKSFTVCGNEVIDMGNLVGEIFPIHHHFEIVHIGLFRKVFEIHSVVRCWRFKAYQQVFFPHGIEEFVVNSYLQLLAYTVDGQDFLLYPDVGFVNRNKLIASGIECTVVGSEPPNRGTNH